MNTTNIIIGIVVVILVAIGIYYMMNKTPEEPVVVLGPTLAPTAPAVPERIKMNTPMHCGKGAKPQGFVDYYLLHSRYGGGNGAQGREFFNSDAAKRMFFKDAAGAPLGISQLEDPDDHAANIRYIYNDIVKETGKKPTFMAVTSRSLEYPQSGRGNQWSYTFDESWTPDATKSLQLTDAWCKAGRKYLPVGTVRADRYKFHHTDSDTHVVYDVRGGVDKTANYACRRPEAGQLGSEIYNFTEINRDPDVATEKCKTVMGCTSDDQCYATMNRGDSAKYGCLKCELMD
jgi:hypothetical protein